LLTHRSPRAPRRGATGLQARIRGRSATAPASAGPGVGRRWLTGVRMETYGRKTGLRPRDALIAATAVEHHLPLCTADRKHYRVISELDLKVYRPRER